MIEWQVDGHVAVATINRPERRNALDAAHCDELRGLLQDAAGSVRVVVLTGAGSAFCAGADLGSRFEGHQDSFHDVLQQLLESVVEFPAPVVAAVNGPALGAGTQLASVCDLRVAGAGAVFGIPAARLGIMISGASIERLVRQVGLAHATEMLLTGRRYTAGEAAGIGLAHRVVDDALAAAREWAEEIASLAPLSVQGHKAALTLVGRSGALDAAARAEVASLIERCVNSDDLAEGVKAFAEKRPPDFQGR